MNCDDNNSCVPGLHVGNLDYIEGYMRGHNAHTHNTFVDPMHVGAVTNDGSGALRVKQYMTHSSFAGVTRSIYHSSTYAKLTDAEWKAMLEAAIQESVDVASKAATKSTEMIIELIQLSK